MKTDMKRYLSLLILLLLTILPLVGCEAKAPLCEEELYALDTIITLSAYSSETEGFDLAKTEIRRIEALLSVTEPDSDVSKINSSPEKFVAVSDECFELIKTSLQISESCKGAFDITVYPALKLWGFTSSSYRVPDKSELLEVKDNIGYNKIILDDSTKSVKIPKGVSIDLGGIAKGYIADKAAEILSRQGVTSALLNFGGNIRLVGSKPHGESFKIGIKAPFGEGYFAVLSADNKTVSTSGGYERYFEESGNRYHHIINPSTLAPAESDVISSTVVGDKGEICDALSTAAFVCGTKGIEALASEYTDYSFVILTEDTVFVSKNISADFELTDAYKDLKISII